MKRNVKKARRLEGKEYVGYKGKIKPSKALLPPCHCRQKCFLKVTELERIALYTQFWKNNSFWDQRRQFVSQSIELTEIGSIDIEKEGRRGTAKPLISIGF